VLKNVEKDIECQILLLVMIIIRYQGMAAVVIVKLKSFGAVKAEIKLNQIIVGTIGHLQLILK